MRCHLCDPKQILEGVRLPAEDADYGGLIL